MQKQIFILGFNYLFFSSSRQLSLSSESLEQRLALQSFLSIQQNYFQPKLEVQQLGHHLLVRGLVEYWHHRYVSTALITVFLVSLLFIMTAWGHEMNKIKS